MSAEGQVRCARCGGMNRHGAQRCWVCATPLASVVEPAVPPSFRTTQPGKKSPVTPLRLVGIVGGITALIVVTIGAFCLLFIVLLAITCFGLMHT